MLNYPAYAAELEHLLDIDQKVWKSFWEEYYSQQGTTAFKTEFKKVRRTQQNRSKRMLQILDAINQPSISNIGVGGAKAMSLIALHDSLNVLKRVLNAFVAHYERDKNNTYFQAIPSMVDRVKLLERKPQIFATQWDIDKISGRFLPTVEDFEHVNEKRAEYGIEPLHWPKSLAIPESEQPWLNRPLSELVMRDITDDEFIERYQDYLI